MAVSEEEVEAAAIAFAVVDGCGLTIDGERVLCCDPRVPKELQNLSDCHCRSGIRAALEAAAKVREEQRLRETPASGIE